MDNPLAPDEISRPTENKLHDAAVDELYRFAVTNFPKIDKDRNGYLSAVDLDDALAGGQFNDKEQAQLRVLRGHIDQIAALDNTGWFTKDLGISTQDLLNMDYLWKKRDSNVSYAEQIRDFGLANFGKLDFDKTGRIMGYEGVAAAGEGCYAPEKGSIVKAMGQEDQKSFSLLFRNWNMIGHGESTPHWMCKPYNFSEGSVSISREDLLSYPGKVANRPQYELINKLTDELK